jgi:hypothetical protein
MQMHGLNLLGRRQRRARPCPDPGRRRFPRFPIAPAGVRAVLRIMLGIVLTLGGVPTLAAQSDGDSTQVATRDKLRTLFATYPPAKEFRWYRTGDPYVIEGFLDKGLIHTPRFEIFVTVTPHKTIWFRIYPMFGGGYINLDSLTDAKAAMQKLLRQNYNNFFFWGADNDLDVYAGFEFTLESGFPEEAIKVVIRSIPLIDQSVGEIIPFMEE